MRRLRLLRALLDNEMLESYKDQDSSNGESFTAYRVTDRGMDWLFENQERLALKQETRPTSDGDNIPF